MTSVGFHIGIAGFLRCCINHPLESEVNAITSKGKIHPAIAKKRYVRRK